jgi:pimeloyl-ACP methyl ester carboxylesterase
VPASRNEAAGPLALHVTRVGAGRPVLFLHGIDGLRSSQPFLDRLAMGASAIAPDHPGFGKSEMPLWIESIHDMAYFYLRYLDELGLGPIDVVGHSLGAWLALEMAIRSAAPFRSITLVSAAGIHLPGVPRGDLFMRAPDVVLRSMVASSELGEELVKRTAADQGIELRNRYAIARVGWNPPMHNPHLAKWLHRITCPVQIIWGQQDALLPVDYAHEFQRLMPGASLHVLPSCGHLPHVEQPERAASLILSFIEEGTSR